MDKATVGIEFTIKNATIQVYKGETYKQVAGRIQSLGLPNVWEVIDGRDVGRELPYYAFDPNLDDNVMAFNIDNKINVRIKLYDTVTCKDTVTYKNIVTGIGIHLDKVSSQEIKSVKAIGEDINISNMIYQMLILEENMVETKEFLFRKAKQYLIIHMKQKNKHKTKEQA